MLADHKQRPQLMGIGIFVTGLAGTLLIKDPSVLAKIESLCLCEILTSYTSTKT